MKNIHHFVVQAVEGDGAALEAVVTEIRDYIFNLSLRMLGTISDAEDATQDILIRVITKLSSFREEADFHTWVYRIAVNYLFDYRKSMFSQHPLDFDFYANDIRAGYVEDMDEILTGMNKEELAEELKLSCTNVMLQCLDPQARCIFILGTMFHLDSRMAGEILDMTPENYRQKLSRARKKMAAFLSEYCGLSGTGMCSCRKRISYAIEQHRLQPGKLEYSSLPRLQRDVLKEYTARMNEIETQMPVFENLPSYASGLDEKAFIRKLMKSEDMSKIKSYQEV